MKRLVDRHPFIFCALLLAALVGFAYLARSAFPTSVIGSAGDLAPGATVEPSALDRLLGLFRDAETLFWTLTLALAGVVLAVLGWGGAGLGDQGRHTGKYSGRQRFRSSHSAAESPTGLLISSQNLILQPRAGPSVPS